jgi:hypothetical protein
VRRTVKLVSLRQHARALCSGAVSGRPVTRHLGLMAPAQLSRRTEAFARASRSGRLSSPPMLVSRRVPAHRRRGRAIVPLSHDCPDDIRSRQAARELAVVPGTKRAAKVAIGGHGSERPVFFGRHPHISD